MSESDRDQLQEQSKSARKRAHQGVQALAVTLLELTAAQAASVPMSLEVGEAVVLGRGLTRGARKRHVRHLANLLQRDDLDSIVRAVQALQGQSRAEAARLHRAERWRERLLTDGDAALGELCDEYPDAQRQHLRQLVRTVHRERERGAPPRRFRELLRYLRQLDEALD
jgi:ribosome-associated protein